VEEARANCFTAGQKRKGAVLQLHDAKRTSPLRLVLQHSPFRGFDNPHSTAVWSHTPRDRSLHVSRSARNQPPFHHFISPDLDAKLFSRRMSYTLSSKFEPLTPPIINHPISDPSRTSSTFPTRRH